MTIDAHAHVIVPELLAEEWGPRVRWEDGEQIVELGGRAIKAAVNEFVDLNGILQHQDEAGIDHVLLCPWVTLLFNDTDPGEGLARCRIQNEALAALTRDPSGRVSALGAVPLQDPVLAASELVTLMAGGDLSGVEIAASAGGDYLGHERFEPFWAAAEQTGALVFIHPTTRGFDEAAFSDGYLWNTVGNPFETTITAAHMVMNGVMERHPRLRVLLAHAGGALLALRGRLRHAHGFQPQARSRLTESPEDSIRRFYFDTITHDPALLRALVDYAGPEHVLLGSDYPFDMADARPADGVRALGLARDAEAAILGGNAARLLGLDHVGREEMVR